MRVVSGGLRGRRIATPDGPHVRPTTDKAREAIFNALGSIDAIADARVIDLFAGSGALGIEAISRGAAECVFVERDRRASAVIVANLDQLGIADRCRVVTGDALVHAGSLDCDVALADPPYDFARWDELLEVVRAELVVAEADHEIEADPMIWETLRAKRYGRTWVTFLRRKALP
jgi:16S rRNA (guanine966-N2)-methyltransferase